MKLEKILVESDGNNISIHLEGRCTSRELHHLLNAAGYKMNQVIGEFVEGKSVPVIERHYHPKSKHHTTVEYNKGVLDLLIPREDARGFFANPFLMDFSNGTEEDYKFGKKDSPKQPVISNALCLLKRYIFGPTLYQGRKERH